MKRLSRQEGNLLWDDLWADMHDEWFKVEVLQDYSAEDKSRSLDAWMAGDKEKSLELLGNDSNQWNDACREKAETGVQLTRIHVVDYPLSDYVEWEVEVYKTHNIPHGKEDVYLVDRKDLVGIDLPAGDFMIFDKQRVILNDYDETGYAYQQTLYGEGDDIRRFLDLRELLLKADKGRV
jgi:hypothetical protein